MKLRTRFAVAPALWLASLAACAPAFTMPPCPTVDGVAEVLGPGRVVLLGEIHGTAESPAFVETLACHALARKLGVTVALELPQDEEAAVVRFLAGDGIEAGVSVVEALPFWTREFQDGRTSRAMFRVLETMRGLIESGADLRVILLDKPEPFDQRDREMSGRLLSAIDESPDDLFVALVGNLHARTTSESGRMGERVLAAVGPERLVSLNVSHSGGSAWICEMTAGCGPLELSGRGEGTAPEISLFGEADGNGFHGKYFVGEITASPPAVEAREESAERPEPAEPAEQGEETRG